MSEQNTRLIIMWLGIIATFSIFASACIALFRNQNADFLGQIAVGALTAMATAWQVKSQQNHSAPQDLTQKTEVTIEAAVSDKPEAKEQGE